MNRAGKNKKKETYQIRITVIEAKHLEPNTNPMVVVRVGNRKRKTAIRKMTDNPHYNEYFVFDLAADMDTLLSTSIEIAVYLCGFLGRTKFYGNITFEVATVWDQPDHQYHHKWAMLINPRDLATGPAGYVKCNIAVHIKGQKFNLPPESDGENDIEGNLLLPLGDIKHFTARQRAQYIFTLHRAEDLPIEVVSRRKHQCCVTVSFAGMKALVDGRRSSGSGLGNPHFDKRLVFTEMFPSLSHRARISLMGKKVSGQCGDVFATHFINFKNISNSGDYGYMPTFGPSFVHLYAEDSNVVEPIYRGRLLLSLKTELQYLKTEADETAGLIIKPAASIPEASLWDNEEYLLVGVLYDINMIDRSLLPSGKTVSFEISLGNAGNQKFSDHQHICHKEAVDGNEIFGPATGCASSDSQSETLSQIVTSLDESYNYISLGAKKPCIFVKSWWPNTEWRTRNSNRLNFMAHYLERKIEEVEFQLSMEQESAYIVYNTAMHALERHCICYIDSLYNVASACERMEEEEDFVACMTNLDKHRLNYCKKEIEAILERVKVNGDLIDNRFIRIAMQHSYRHLQIIRNLCEDPQQSLPDMFLWVLRGSRRLAYSRLQVRHIIYAKNCPERGRDCGQKLEMFLKRPGVPQSIACRVEIFVWLGNVKSAQACWNVLPPNYASSDLDREHLHIFPRSLHYDKAFKFQLRVHIFQGRFEPGMDLSGLLDPMIRVTFGGYSMSTRVMKQTLDPIWDETLVFPLIEIYGSRDYIKNRPPKVVLEAFDKDFGNRLELYGRCTACPLVKLNTETYSALDFPPKLIWHRFTDLDKPASADFGGGVLAALELIEIDKKDLHDSELDNSVVSLGGRVLDRIPDHIRPKMTSYRMEVIFWGVRDFKRLGLVNLSRPKIVIQCANAQVESEVMANAKKFPNFREICMSVDLDLAEEETYYPPLVMKAYDSRGFGFFKYVGVCSIPSIRVFMQPLITKNEYEDAIYQSQSKARPTAYHVVPIESEYRQKKPDDAYFAEEAEEKETAALISYKKPCRSVGGCGLGHLVKRLLNWRRARAELQAASAPDRDESLDWWSKYYASLEEEKNRANKLEPKLALWSRRVATFRVYNAELEAQPEFARFQDRLRTFKLRRGKEVGDSETDENNSVGKFKGYITIYRWPHPENSACVTRFGKSVTFGMCGDYPLPMPIFLLVRLYVITGINLRPSDPLTGKADPYLHIHLGNNNVNDRKNYIPNQLNPTFGRVFEIDASFPRDHTLIIQVWDFDVASSDDLIGETRIDIESRFYSQHRAHCGLSFNYDTTGYNAWRDREKPTQILAQLCQRYNLPMPEYWEDYVKIGARKFPCPRQTKDNVDKEEKMALSVLHQWKEFPICGCVLVPEHIERRALFNPKKPGLEQGKLEMWIDMFAVDELPTRPAIDISPQLPEDYELRVTVWNTEDVPLVDSQFLTGEKCSDIYVKGWILPEAYQKTDVHYNSLTGEGNFNWRFVFRFTWARGERVMIVKRKSSIFARAETEWKVPCKLNLQVWDSDHFSKDDFLGALSLDLANMPKGSHNAQSCRPKLIDPRSPRFSLFRAQRTRAWWPLTTSDAFGHYFPAGKIEMEMSLVPAVEADAHPVGKGRDPPEPLPPPDRPETSFSWFRNPWKACCFVVCRYYKWRLLGCCCLMLVVLFVALAVYAFPGYSVKRFLGA